MLFQETFEINNYYYYFFIVHLFIIDKKWFQII